MRQKLGVYELHDTDDNLEQYRCAKLQREEDVLSQVHQLLDHTTHEYGYGQSQGSSGLNEPTIKLGNWNERFQEVYHPHSRTSLVVDTMGRTYIYIYIFHS